MKIITKTNRLSVPPVTRSPVLRPVNEYKIAEKIVEANRELFGEDYDPTTTKQPNSVAVAPSHGEDSIEVNADDVVIESGIRRVKFRAELEDFEPDFITDNEDEYYEDDDEGANTQQDYSESDVDDGDELNEDKDDGGIPGNDKINMMLDSPRRKPPPPDIDRSASNPSTNKSTIKMNEAIAVAPTTESSAATILPTGGSPVSEAHNDADDEIDEICEVIDDFGLAESTDIPLLSPSMVLTTTASSENRPQNHRYDDDDHQRSQSSDSNRSSADSQDHQRVKKASTTLAAQYGSLGGVNTSSSPKPRPKSSNEVRRNHLSSSHSSHSSDTSSQHHKHHHNHHYNTHGVVTDDDDAILKIQLNFKPCCEFKNAEARRLPRYCGYVSQYGLSKEQLDRRDMRRERHHQRKAKRSENLAAEASNKSRVNEEAFARWLAVKMRTAGTSTGSRNMYDYVPQAAAKKKLSR